LTQPFAVGQTILVRKHDGCSGLERLSYAATVVAVTERCVAVTARSTLDNVAFDGVIVYHDDWYTEYYYPGCWFNVYHIASSAGETKGWYCNVAMPFESDDRGIVFTDLYLDLFVHPDGHFAVLDEDELAAVATELGEQVVGMARAALDELIGMAAQGLLPRPEPAAPVAVTAQRDVTVAARPRSSWSLVIFDCDGVLVDSEPIVNRVFAEMLAEIGLPLSVEETTQRFIGRSLADCMVTVEELLGHPVPGSFLPTLRVREHAAVLVELCPIAGIVDALAQISLPMCVASSSSPESVERMLGVTGLLPHFAGRIFSASQVPHGKPAPDVYLHAARTMGVPPARCVVVEDTPIGARAGIAAGMTVLGYAATTDPASLAAVGARVFADMRELPQLLGLRAAS
jgi:beta-phosphoglucomutase-like phosphatase (HAD superfamily)/protein associated with RNAse G/E